MSLLRATARAIRSCFRRPDPLVICAAVQPLQQQPSRSKVQFHCRCYRNHYEKVKLVYVPCRPTPHPLEKIADLNSGKAGLPLLPIGGTGSVFDTEIKRRTTIRDPNQSKARPFEHQRECLQWTDWRMLRDVNHRVAIAELHPLRKNLLSIRKAHQLPLELQHEAYKEVCHKLPATANRSAATNRCVVSSRARGKVRMWRLSRIVWRHLADYNQLSGAMKSFWGP